MRISETPEASGSILVVDAQADSRAKTEKRFLERGLRVGTAANGQEALYKFMLFKPDLVLLMAQLPGLDGFQACQALRQDPFGRDVPVVMVLDSKSMDSVTKAYNAGATDIVVEPVNWSILIQRTVYLMKAGKAFKRLKASELGFEHAQRIAKIGNWEWDLQAKKMRWSQYLSHIVGVDPDAPKSFDLLLGTVHPDDRAELAGLMKDAFESGKSFSRDHRLTLPNGGTRSVHQEVEVSLDSRGQPMRIRGIIQDISGRIESERKIRYYAYHNSLTGLHNRQSFKENVQNCLELCQGSSKQFAAFFIDMDGLKRINDTFGHQFGDQLIMEVAHRLEALVNGFKLVTNPVEQTLNLAHSGGGMFLLLVYPFEDPFRNHTLAPLIMHELGKPYVLDSRELFITSSMGICVYPKDGSDFDTLVKNGERALHHAKEIGKNSCKFYSSDIESSSAESIRLESDMRKALSNGELSLFFQPKLNIEDRTVQSVEALVRWNHPTLGALEPGDFIPLAEENGLILQIGEWVIREACHINKSWQRLGHSNVSVAVNLSARQFLRQPIVDIIQKALKDAALDPHYFEVEITESVMMKDVEESISILEKLKSMGIKVAIDDFGTGYSSLSYLKRLPIDILKIDKAFIQNLAEDPDNQAITGAILAMCNRLGLKVVAEGVEKRSYLDLLRRYHCDMAQGYLISKPISQEAVPHILEPDYYRFLFEEPAEIVS